MVADLGKCGWPRCRSGGFRHVFDMIKGFRPRTRRPRTRREQSARPVSTRTQRAGRHMVVTTGPPPGYRNSPCGSKPTLAYRRSLAGLEDSR